MPPAPAAPARRRARGRERRAAAGNWHDGSSWSWPPEGSHMSTHVPASGFNGPRSAPAAATLPYDGPMAILPWRPLLGGEDADRALAAAVDIAAATSQGVAGRHQGLDPAGIPVRDNTLSGGRAGQCLLHAYLALHGAGDGYGDTALELLDRAAEAAAAHPMSASLYLG